MKFYKEMNTVDKSSKEKHSYWGCNKFSEMTWGKHFRSLSVLNILLKEFKLLSFVCLHLFLVDSWKHGETQITRFFS